MGRNLGSDGVTGKNYGLEFDLKEGKDGIEGQRTC